VRARGEAPAEKLAALVEQLDSKVPAERQKACAELVAIGPPAIPLLRQTVRDVDNPDLAAQARRCLKALEGEAGSLTAAAARVLAYRRPTGVAGVLLDYLPHAENENVMEEVKNALIAVAYDRGRADPALLRALSDEHPLRRANAITALCQSGIAEPRATLRKLLTDPMPSVRLRASLALARASDAKAVSTLIALLADVSGEQARDVEGFLTELAGEQAPRVSPGTDQASREKARDAWAKWWLDTEGPGLLDELKKRTLTDATREKGVSLIEKLGDDSFEVRQQAEKDLLAMGGQILPLLKQALKHSDLEVRNRAAKCLTVIEKEKATPLSPVTARLIALRKPKGAAEALLAFLPFAEDEGLVDELQSALNAVAYPGGKAHPALVKGLHDKAGIRRAAAAEALCHGPAGEHLPQIRKLLRDKEPAVRLRVALALAGAREPEAVPVLIALVSELPSEQSAPAEDYLTRLAKERAPKDLPEGDEARKKRSEAWAKWWNDNKAAVVMVDRYSPAARERYLGYTLLVQANNNQLIELGADNKQRWIMTGLLNPYDAQVLPGNKVLVAEYNGQRVTERNLKGDILWEKKMPGYWPMQVERLRNGNTFIVARNALLEVDRSGREVMKIDRPHDVMSARKLPNGQIVVVTSARQVLRLDRSGKQLKSFAVPNVFYNTNEVLSNGHVLIPLGWQNQVAEYDAEGKQVATLTVTQPMHATRLPNGHYLVATQTWPTKVYELDRKGRQVGEIPTTTYTFRVRRR
jgi:HEAT repeat protein